MRVVADGESLWLELNKEQIYLNNFRKRQRTQSRQYWTMNGVTIHQQLTLEPGKYPRKHKLSVWLIDRPGCSSKLEAGKWHAHVHQLKIYHPDLGSRWLGAGRSVRKLKMTFGEAYHPRHIKSSFRSFRNNYHAKASMHRSRRKPVHVSFPPSVLCDPSPFAPWEILKQPQQMGSYSYNPRTGNVKQKPKFKPHFFHHAARRKVT